MPAYLAHVCNARRPREDVRSPCALLLRRAARHTNQGHHRSCLDSVTIDPHLLVSQLQHITEVHGFHRLVLQSCLCNSCLSIYQRTKARGVCRNCRVLCRVSGFHR